MVLFAQSFYFSKFNEFLLSLSLSLCLDLRTSKLRERELLEGLLWMAAQRAAIE